MLVDFISTDVNCEIGRTTKFQKAPGGAPANVAVGLAKLGVKPGFIGKVGNDEFGLFLKSELERNKVDTRGMILDGEHLTTLAFAAVKTDGSKDILFYRSPGAT
jgi:sugar/nucleoside kinase (ribokinase family)